LLDEIISHALREWTNVRDESGSHQHVTNNNIDFSLDILDDTSPTFIFRTKCVQ
jgi:hypothetical protein